MYSGVGEPKRRINGDIRWSSDAMQTGSHAQAISPPMYFLQRLFIFSLSFFLPPFLLRFKFLSQFGSDGRGGFSMDSAPWTQAVDRISNQNSPPLLLHMLGFVVTNWKAGARGDNESDMSLQIENHVEEQIHRDRSVCPEGHT